jgi:pimeloyl-ACP methyl ester carboxylesterase
MTQAACRLAADNDYGARPPLVLLHGLTFDRSLWRPSLAELRRIDPGRRVLALDLPGHGASPA